MKTPPAKTTTVPTANTPTDRPRVLRVKSGLKAGGNDDPHGAF